MGFLSKIFGLKTDNPTDTTNSENDVRKSVQEQFNKRLTELRNSGKSDTEIAAILEKEIDTGFGLKPAEKQDNQTIRIEIDPFDETPDTELWKWELFIDHDHKNCKKCIKMSQYPPNTFDWWEDKGLPGYGKTCKHCYCTLRPLTEDEMKEYLKVKTLQSDK